MEERIEGTSWTGGFVLYFSSQDCVFIFLEKSLPLFYLCNGVFSPSINSILSQLKLRIILSMRELRFEANPVKSSVSEQKSRSVLKT